MLRCCWNSVPGSDLHLYREGPDRPAMPRTHSHTLSLSRYRLKEHRSFPNRERSHTTSQHRGPGQVRIPVVCQHTPSITSPKELPAPQTKSSKCSSLISIARWPKLSGPLHALLCSVSHMPTRLWPPHAHIMSRALVTLRAGGKRIPSLARQRARATAGVMR